MKFNNHRYSTILMLVFLTLLNCEMEKPAQPSWETALRIPLMSKKIPISDIVEEESNLLSDSTGQVHFKFEKKIDTFLLEDKLSLSPNSNEYRTELGVFKVETPEHRSMDVSLTDIYPMSSSMAGESAIIPPFEISPIIKKLAPYPDFAWISIETGEIIITLTNNLDIILGKPLHLNLYDCSDNKLIDALTIDKLIHPGENVIKRIQLDGKRISNSLQIKISGASAGTQGEIVPIDSASSMLIECEISELHVSSALAQVSDLHIGSSSFLHISDSIAIHHATIKQGSMQFCINQSFSANATVEISFPQLFDKSGRELKETISLSGSGDHIRNIMLDGFTVQSEKAAIGNQHLEICWHATIKSSNKMLLIDEHDFVNMNFSISEIIFQEVSGVLKTVEMEIEPLREEIDFFDDLSSIQLQNAGVTIYIKNSINFPAQTDLLLKGISRDGDIANLTVREKIPAASPHSIETTTIILDKRNSNIVEFLNNLPQKVEIYGTVSLGDGVCEGTVTQNDFFEAMLEITAPLSISMDAQEIEVKPDTLKIKNDVREKITTNLLSGEFFATINNSIPLGASIYINISKTDSSVYLNPDIVIGPVEIQPAKINDSGIVTDAVQKSTHFMLTEDDLRLFENPELFMGLKIKMPGTENQIITITSSNFINVNAHTIMKLNLTKN
ncbi:hypothetical protein GF337_04685 [candidate division KSB1 bacterium]|nr:hypothetical protein [candidate division KSB1 bacterium]